MTRASINIIGCGKLGKTLANLFNKQKNLLLSGIVNSSYESAVKAVQFIGGGQAYAQLRDLPAADFFFITTPDDKIQAVCEELVSGNQLQPGTIVVHCSGSLSSEVLSKARQKGGHIASLHPVKSFAQPQECVTSFSGTYCALEGDAAALPRLKNLFGSLGAKIFLIKQEKKALYHAASVLANNYLISLHHQALQAYHFADLDEQTANHLTTMLMTDALQNLKKLPHSAALTGPLQRGDKQTLEKHLQALAPHSELSSVYTTLGRSTLPLTQHSETQKKSLALLFKASPSKVLTASWLDTPLGPMIALADEEALCALNFADQEDLERELARLRTKTQACLVPGETAVHLSIKKELAHYFEGRLKEFTTPIQALGSVFQKTVWAALRKIPRGETRSYAELAKSIGRPSAFRAVALANGANPLALVVPCHRVIYANGDLGGYSSGLSRKEWLLQHEKSV